MKRIVLLLATLLLAGCATERIARIPREVTFAGFDFRPYTERGFMFTPDVYGGEYDAIGLVSATIYPEAYREHQSRGAETALGKWSIKDVDAQEAIDEMYRRASTLGADALVQFTIKSIEKTVETGDIRGLTLSGVEVSGFAIKRK